MYFIHILHIVQIHLFACIYIYVYIHTGLFIDVSLIVETCERPWCQKNAEKCHSVCHFIDIVRKTAKIWTSMPTRTSVISSRFAWSRVAESPRKSTSSTCLWCYWVEMSWPKCISQPSSRLPKKWCRLIKNKQNVRVLIFFPVHLRDNPPPPQKISAFQGAYERNRTLAVHERVDCDTRYRFFGRARFCFLLASVDVHGRALHVYFLHMLCIWNFCYMYDMYLHHVHHIYMCKTIPYCNVWNGFGQ